ncbi:MAG: hypothetical protein IKX20_02970 [Paludibacteraceae bacterium]|nr:hypothetical protein [Paludibacteraceae bacterium]
MAKGTSKAGGGGAYKQVVNYIKKNGIPGYFINAGEEQTKAVYRAISDQGKLTAAEQKIYDSIRYDAEEQSLWHNGRYESVKGYTEKEIDGIKKFWAHSSSVNRR